MKKIGIVLSFIMVFAAGAAQAQSRNVQEGVRVGINIATLTGSGAHSASSKLGFDGTFFLTYNFTDYFALQPEAGVSFAGAKGPLRLGGNTSNQYSNIKSTYVQIPILAKFKLSSSSDFAPAVFVGPSFDFNVTNKYDVAGSTNNLYPDSNPNFLSVSGVIGVGANIQHVVLDVRLDYGLTTAYNTPSSSRNQAYLVTIGYIF